MFQDAKAGLYDDDDYSGQNGDYQYNNNNYGNEYDDYGDYGDYGEETGEVGGSGGQKGQGKAGAKKANNEVDDPELAAAIAASLADQKGAENEEDLPSSSLVDDQIEIQAKPKQKPKKVKKPQPT